MVFELVSNSTSPAPAAEETSIRFYFQNGTFASNSSLLTSYPLFNSSAPSWMDFVREMNNFAIGDQIEWCAACGNTTGVCASSSSSPPPASGGVGAGKGSGGSGGGVSNPVAGVIGALVTLAVVLGLEAAVMVIAGLRVARKKKGAPGDVDGDGNGAVQNGGKES